MHAHHNAGELTSHLRAILGEEGFVRLCDALGGTRAYIPYTMRDDNDLVVAVGRGPAEKLSAALAPATIRVPLARRDRALWWRAKGLSDAKIARKLGITETGVGKLFAREADLPARPGRGTNPGQLELL